MRAWVWALEVALARVQELAQVQAWEQGQEVPLQQAQGAQEEERPRPQVVVRQARVLGAEALVQVQGVGERPPLRGQEVQEVQQARVVEALARVLAKIWMPSPTSTPPPSLRGLLRSMGEASLGKTWVVPMEAEVLKRSGSQALRGEMLVSQVELGWLL